MFELFGNLANGAGNLVGNIFQGAGNAIGGAIDWAGGLVKAPQAKKVLPSEIQTDWGSAVSAAKGWIDDTNFITNKPSASQTIRAAAANPAVPTTSNAFKDFLGGTWNYFVDTGSQWAMGKAANWIDDIFGYGEPDPKPAPAPNPQPKAPLPTNPNNTDNGGGFFSWPFLASLFGSNQGQSSGGTPNPPQVVTTKPQAPSMWIPLIFGGIAVAVLFYGSKND